MKNYIGVVVVKAEPAEQNGMPGYLVRLFDKIVFWTSKDNFEKAYRALDCERPER